MWDEFDPVGRWFGPYRVVQGGAQLLYAHDPFFSRHVAVVLLQPPPGVEHRDFLFRLERETPILRDLEHPNILPVYDCGYAHEHFLWSPPSRQAKLSTRLKKRPLPLWEAGPILHRIASAMDAIHSKQLFHGDIKPANILIPQREPVICQIVKLRSAVWRPSVFAYTAHQGNGPEMLFPAPNGISG
jgi:serine/threonine protein kinase